MRPTWIVVGVAAGLGFSAGVAVTRTPQPGHGAASDEPRGAPAPPDAQVARKPDSPRHPDANRAGREVAASESRTETRPGKEEAARARELESAGRVKGWIADLARAREAKDRKLFDESLRNLLHSDDAQAHEAVRNLIADPGFDFPDPAHALWCGTARALQASAVPGLAAAARARYERDARRPGRSWDGHAWLHLLAAQADAADLAWIADQYDLAPERHGEVVAALGVARPDLAREAIGREIRRGQRRDGIWEAIGHLQERSPADAFALLDEIVASDAPFPHHDAGEVFRAWVRCAPKDRLPEVRSRIHALAAAGRQVRELITPVQALADRNESVTEFATIVAAAGRDLRRLVDEEKRADGTGPFYAIEYHEVAHTPENLAALEYAIEQLGKDRTHGCQNVLAEIRGRSAWK